MSVMAGPLSTVAKRCGIHSASFELGNPGGQVGQAEYLFASLVHRSKNEARELALSRPHGSLKGRTGMRTEV